MSIRDSTANSTQESQELGNSGSIVNASRIYTGVLAHHRHVPFSHGFRQKLFMLYLDLDEITAIFHSSSWWSRWRMRFTGFCRSDYYGDAQRPLDDCIRELVLERAGLAIHGPIRLLAHTRCLGFCFNPIAIYYCFDLQDKLEAVVAEVTNTPWGERHQYVLKVSEGTPPSDAEDSDADAIYLQQTGRGHQQNLMSFEFAKELHVSPFYPMNMTYGWRCNTPDDALIVHIDLWQDAKKQFDASLSMREMPITNKNLRWVFWRFPLMPWQVVLNIYWQALMLWWRGARYFRKPDRQPHGY